MGLVDPGRECPSLAPGNLVEGLPCRLDLVDQGDDEADDADAGQSGQQQINATIGFDTGEGYRLFANGVNILDQQRYQMFGGAVIGRRVLVGISTLF